MKTLVGGAIAVILGVIGIVAWFPQFLTVLVGTVPVMFLLGGALAIYLGVDELKDTWKERKEGKEGETPVADSEPGEDVGEDVEKYKAEIDELKEEIETLKKD